MKKIAVYEWKGWGSFLINRLFPNAKRIEAHWRQTSDEVLNLIDDDTDYFIPHINMSITDKLPSDRESLLEKLDARGIKVLNPNLVDITRGTIQKQIIEAGLLSTSVDRDSLHDEDRLIIKSAFNCGGGMERKLKKEDKLILGISDFDKTKVPSTLEYRVCSKKDVPKDSWGDPMLQIERFITNDRGRLWRPVVFGDRVSIIEALVPNIDVKKTRMATHTGIHHGKFGETDGKISFFGDGEMDKLFKTVEKFVSHMKLDFCVMDIAEGNVGEYYIIDVNSTPYWGRWSMRHTSTVTDNMFKSNLFEL